MMLKILRKVIEEALTERQREMITLYYFDRDNIPQIAEKLGVNRSTVSRTISRGRRNIMEKMKFFI
ncbi:MAG: sigma-70 family RNA polymerase sigma factor [Oscillospiraceae bacterium]|nr:sigma-70 family RNA polymerase sigma factor [Oscillospiraceae bacterium]